MMLADGRVMELCKRVVKMLLIEILKQKIYRKWCVLRLIIYLLRIIIVKLVFTIFSCFVFMFFIYYLWKFYISFHFYFNNNYLPILVRSWIWKISTIASDWVLIASGPFRLCSFSSCCDYQIVIKSLKVSVELEITVKMQPIKNTISEFTLSD